MLSSSGVFGKVDTKESDKNSSAYLEAEAEHSQSNSLICEVDVVKLSPKDNIVNRPYMIPTKVAHNFMTRKIESPAPQREAQPLDPGSAIKLQNGQSFGCESDTALRITNKMTD